MIVNGDSRPQTRPAPPFERERRSGEQTLGSRRFRGSLQDAAMTSVVVSAAMLTTL
jgi:hypothetical protein